MKRDSSDKSSEKSKATPLMPKATPLTPKATPLMPKATPLMPKATPLMPKATAVWLIDNTALTFAQIAVFCGLHALEVQSIADGETVAGISGVDPVRNLQISQSELDRCIADPDAQLTLLETALPTPQRLVRGARYTPLVKRVAKPDAILWCLKNYPDLADSQIIRLFGTTKSMITSIKTRSHWNMRNLQPRNPADLGLCTYTELQAAVEKAEQVKARARAEKSRLDRLAAKKAGVTLEEEPHEEPQEPQENSPQELQESSQENTQPDPFASALADTRQD